MAYEAVALSEMRLLGRRHLDRMAKLDRECTVRCNSIGDNHPRRRAPTERAYQLPRDPAGNTAQN